MLCERSVILPNKFKMTKVYPVKCEAYFSGVN